MSHFSVLVITDDPTEEAVSKALAPYREFECTGADDEYVRSVDITDQCRKEYESQTALRYVDPNGNPHDPYDDRFYRDPTQAEMKAIGPIAGTGGGGGISWTSKDWGDGRGYRAKVHFLPEGWSEMRQPITEVERFANWVTEYYGKKLFLLPEPRNADTPEIRELLAHRKAVIEERDREQQLRLLNGYMIAATFTRVKKPLVLSGDYKYGYAIVDDDRNVLQVIDRTNADSWEWIDAEGNTLGRTTREETLPGVRQDEKGNFFLCRKKDEIEPPREVHLLHTLHSQEERGQNARTAAEVAREADIRPNRGAVQQIVGEAKRTLQDMPNPDGTEAENWRGRIYSARGPLSQDGENPGDPVLALQSDDRACEGQSSCPCGGSGIHSPVQRRLISGSKWDWWMIGGRFGNHFRLKPGRTGISLRADQLKDELAFSQRFTAAFGAAEGNLRHQAELATAIAEVEAPKSVTYADIAFKGDIDFEAMRDDAEREAADRYDKYHTLTAPHPPIIQWEEMRDVVHKGDIERARVAFREQPAIQAVEAIQEFRFMMDHSSMAVSRESYLSLARAKAISTFAVVKDETWYERGEMGWWGCVRNETPQEEWFTQFGMLIDSLPDSAVLAVVYCHI